MTDVAPETVSVQDLHDLGEAVNVEVDRTERRIGLAGLIAVAVICLCFAGALALVGKAVPDFFVSVGSGAVAAVGALLVPNRR